MNAILANIYERRAVRKFKNIPIGKDAIEQILDAGRMAPSAINAQPWKFYVLTGPRLIQTLAEEIGLAAEAYFYLAHGVHLSQATDRVFHGAPAVIFVSAPKDYEWAQLDVGMCVQNMMLAAKSLGLESCPVGFGKFVEKVKSFSLLRVPSNEQIVIAVVFGYGDEKPQLRERKRDNAIYLPEIDEAYTSGAGQNKKNLNGKNLPVLEPTNF